MRTVDAAAVGEALAAIDVDALVAAYYREPRWDDPVPPLVHVEEDRWTCATAVADDDGVRGVLLCAGGRRSAHRLLTLFDPDGSPVATLAADALCGEVAAATAAIALQGIGRPVAGTAGVLGAGPLGVASGRRLAALGAEALVVFDPEEARARAAADALARTGVPTAVAADPAGAVRDAQVVVTATSARDPVLRDDWLAEGVAVLALGADRRGRRELDYRVIEGAALVVCDSPALARLLADDLRECVAEGYLDWQEVLALGDVLAGALEAAPATADRVVVKAIDPTGAALAVARALVGSRR